MANNNPYMLSGFQSGFMQGLELVYRDRDAKRQEELHRYRVKEAELGLKTGEATLERERVGLERDKEKSKQENEKYEYERGLRPLQEQSLRNQTALAGAQAGNLRENTRKTKLETDQREEAANAAKQQVHLEQVFKYGARVAENITDPQYLKSAEAFDAFANAGMIMDGATMDSLKADASYALMKTFGPEVRQGIGQPIDAKTAEKIGAPKGSIITDKQIVDFHIEGDEIVIELDVITKNDESKDPWIYKAPITEDRSSKGTDEIRRFPISRMKEIAAAGGSFAQAVKLRQQQNPDQDPNVTAKQIADETRASLAALASRLKPNERMQKRGDVLVDVLTGQEFPLKKGISADKALTTLNNVYTEEVRAVGPENVNMDNVIQKANIMREAAGGDASQSNVTTIRSDVEYQTLPSGARYIAVDDPEQRVRIKK